MRVWYNGMHRDDSDIFALTFQWKLQLLFAQRMFCQQEKLWKAGKGHKTIQFQGHPVIACGLQPIPAEMKPIFPVSFCRFFHSRTKHRTS